MDPVTVEEKIAQGKSQRLHYENIYNLYRLRGNKEMTQKYLDKMPDDIDKLFLRMNHDYCFRGCELLSNFVLLPPQLEIIDNLPKT
jgi:hypothetical protein